MTDLERLDEALAEWKDPEAHPLSNVGGMVVILNAAMDYRDLLANGQRVEWCEAHNEHMHRNNPSICWWSQAVQWSGDDPGDCRIVSRLLVDHPKEADE